MMRKLLRDNVQAALAAHVGPVALSFSGGTDSLCLLWLLLDIGVRPVLYTYYVEGLPSQDLRRARWAAGKYGLLLTEAVIPSDMATLMADVRRIVADGVRGQVCIQCMHGHYYVAPLMQERLIVNGSGVDALYGAYRTFAFDGSRLDKAIFDKVRREHLADANDDAMADQSRLFAQHGVKVAYPYRQENVIALLMGLSWPEINRPRLKAVTVKEFPEFAATKGLWRPRGSQQLVAGTKALHERLLQSPLNVRGHRAVRAIYDDIANGVV